LDKFSYDQEGNRFVCPHGKVFEFDHRHGDRALYRSREGVSCGCGHYRNKDGRAVIKVGEGQFAKRELKIIAQQHHELYKRRKCTVEPVFGQIQVGMGFRRYFYRGRVKVRSGWNLVCAAFNMKKIAALLKARGEVLRLRTNTASDTTGTLFAHWETQLGCLLGDLIRPMRCHGAQLAFGG